jgi:hypothetical protein
MWEAFDNIDHDKSVEWHQQIQVRERCFLSVF